MADAIPYKDFGYSMVGTGGGCDAFMLSDEAGYYILVTVADDCVAPDTDDAEVAIGYYDPEDDEQIDYIIVELDEWLRYDAAHWLDHMRQTTGEPAERQPKWYPPYSVNEGDR